MKRLIILFIIPLAIMGQNNTIRIFPYYPMLTPFVAEEGSGFMSVVAFGTSLGYDHSISENESVEINFKPRIHIFDGDQDAYELRSNINYKRFLKYNFYTSSGLGINFLNTYSSWSPYGGDDNTNILSIGPNLSFGRRTMFSNRFFLDFGLGFAFNYTIYNQAEKTSPIDSSLPYEEWEFYTYPEAQEKMYYLTHVLAFQFGFILQ